jgi:hypothetical protein
MWKPAILIAAACLSGCNSDTGEAIAFAITTVCERTKPVSSAPSGYAATWKESIEAVEATHANDADFSRVMREQVNRLRRDYYQGDGGEEHASFETIDYAGSLEVTQELTTASPDILSVSMRAVFYEAGMSHPNSVGASTLIWSRRWHRPLTQDDVLEVPPDRALRRLALSRFDNPDGLQNPDDPDGIPLRWDRASIGPDGITWFFESYELGGYAAAGSATIGWPALKRYLRPELPFVIREVREAPDTVRKQQAELCTTT